MSKKAQMWKHCAEIREMLRNLQHAYTLGERPNPEDIVVLRGSTEALIELAEEQ